MDVSHTLDMALYLSVKQLKNDRHCTRVFYLFISLFSFRLANVRGAEVAVFNPLDSKCEESLDICCRHPDWRDVPLEQEIELPPKIPVECLDQFTQN